MNERRLDSTTSIAVSSWIAINLNAKMREYVHNAKQ